MSSEGYSSGGNGHISDNGTGIAASERRMGTGRKGSHSGSMAGEDESRSESQPKEDEDRRFLFVIRELEESQRKLNVQVWSSPPLTTVFRRAHVKVDIACQSCRCFVRLSI